MSSEDLKKLSTDVTKIKTWKKNRKKELAKKRKELEDFEATVKQDIIQYDQQIAALQSRMKEIKERSTLAISDHAVIRYLERHYGLDVEAIRAEMRTSSDLTGPLGDGTYGRAVIKDKVMITYLPERH